MTARRAQIAIVGAGPAGMAAALAAREAGAEVLVVDEGVRAGGQIFRQLPQSFVPKHEPLLHPPSHERGRELLARVRAAWIDRLQGATVFAAKPGRLELAHEGKALAIACERLVLCTGAYDRSLAFPGWTLPGVISAGGVQVLVRGYAVKPGARAVVAGTGPLLLPAITALAAAGVEIAGVFEAQRRRTLARVLPSVLLHAGRRREAFFYARALRAARARMTFGHAVVRALGEGGLRAVVVARLDRDGAPIAGTEREIACDVLCVGYGLLPATELASLLGCAMRDEPALGGWVPDHDERMATSVHGVFVAGEIAGIGGADVAIAEGEVAGLAAAASLGLGGGELEARLRRAQRGAGRERRAAAALLRAFALPRGLCAIATDATIVCRCEDVTCAAARAAAELLGKDLRSIKMGTRAGMGPCQGRICQPILDDLLQHRFGGAARRAPPVVQVPIKPVRVETLVQLDQ